MSELPIRCFSKIALHERLIFNSPFISENRIPFQPPTSSQPLRFSHHLSLSSPSSLSSPFNPNKRILQVPISLLPLKDDQARRRIKALAGSRWTIDTDGLDWVSGEKVTANGREEEKDGFIKMSEESFPTGRMNRKWLSDVLDKLVKEANVGNLFFSFQSSLTSLFVFEGISTVY